MGLDAFTEPKLSPVSRAKTTANKKRAIRTIAKKVETIRIANTSIIFPRYWNFFSYSFSAKPKTGLREWIPASSIFVVF
jgi:hypothetical protein